MYKSFECRDFADPLVKRTTTWAILPTDNDIRATPRTGQINYRVKSMIEVISHLQSRGVSIDKTEDYEYGKFAWLTDPDGNKIELFEEALTTVSVPVTACFPIHHGRPSLTAYTNRLQKALLSEAGC